MTGLGPADAFSLYERTPVMMHSIDGEGRLLMVSDAWLAALGYDRDEVIGQPSTAFLTEESTRKARDEVLPAFFAAGRCDDVAYQMVAKDGRVLDVLLSATLERDDAGAPTRTVAVIQDVTRQRAAERQLADERQRLAWIIEGTDVGTWEWNVQTGETRFNERWAKIIGYTLSELEPTNIDTWMSFAHDDDLEASGQALEAHFSGQADQYEVEARMKHKDGHWVWVLDRGRVASWTEDGKPEWMFGTHLDITERKSQEAALERQRRELARSNQDLEQFAYVASHDLQGPLRTVVSFTELLQKRYGANLQGEEAEFFGFVVEGATRMQERIADLLQFSRAGRGEKRPVDANEVMRSLVIELNCRDQVTWDDLPRVDAMQLDQVLLNLVQNGLKFHDGNGAKVHVSAVAVDHAWRFEVKDNGIGIDPAQGRRVFDIFQRLHLEDEYPGSGLGLAICKRVVERNGGLIDFESRPGEGTTFRFTLPRTSR